MEKKAAKKRAGTIIAAVVCIGLIVGLYYYYTVREKKTVEDMGELTEVQKLTTKNLDADYPKTPREVVKLYNRIVFCYYNETYTDDELYALGDQARKLFDDELLENNPREEFFKSLKADIADYHERSKTIVSWNVSKSSEINYQTVDGDECAYVTSSYFINEDKKYSHTDQMYVLRQSEDGKWKILVFYQVEGDSSEDE